MRPPSRKLAKISDIARHAGVSVSTIKHYVHEGLLPKPVKTGKTMAYYEASCVDRVQRIKRLQKEKFLPLEVIRRLIDSGTENAEELDLGKAIARAHRFDPHLPPVVETAIEEHTGYPLGKVRVLEEMGLIFPAAGKKGKSYDAVDRQIIEIAGLREELGLPFDYSLQTMLTYRDAIRTAVEEDARRFVETLLTAIPTREAVRLMTEVDESLDRLMVLLRHQLTRALSRKALDQVNTLGEKLLLLSPFPLAGRSLPATPPSDPNQWAFYCFCAGRFEPFARAAKTDSRLRPSPDAAALSILARLLAGDIGDARALAERKLPCPTARPLENLAAALACLFSVQEAKGFSDPIFLMKKALGHLKRLERPARTSGPKDLAARYVAGAVYTFLPELFGTRAGGIRILRELAGALRTDTVRGHRLPAWCLSTLEEELVPAVELRVHLFLAEALLQQGEPEAGAAALAEVIRLAPPDSEFASRARLESLKLRQAKAGRAP